ncbi:MAG: 1-acyl-sn-glycerol-3-phosphate acyltransferase [Verrucomicrobiota bacterium]
MRGLVRLYYPRIHISGRERIPATGPVLFVANHANSLIDPVIIGISAQRPIHFLAKAPLFEVPVFGPVMRALGMLPAYRGSDDRSQVKRNLETLDTAARDLATGAAVGIFPEGKSHDAATLEQVKSGAARIAAQAVQAGAKGLKIVALGLNYQRKEQFRSAIWVRVAEPIDVEVWLAQHGEEKQAMRQLTPEIDRRLREVVIHLNEAAWEPALNDLEVLLPAEGADAKDPIAALRQRKWIADGINHFMTNARERVEPIAISIRRQREQAVAVGLDLRSPILRLSGPRFLGQMLWQTAKLVFGIVPMLAGTLHHLVPFLLVRLITGKMNQPGRMTIALWRLLIGLPIYAACYVAVWKVMIGYFLPWVAWAWALAMPFAGFYALNYWRQVRDAARLWWHQLRLLPQRATLDALRAEQQQLRVQLGELVHAFDRVQPRERITAVTTNPWTWRRRVAWCVTVLAALYLATQIFHWTRQHFIAEIHSPGPDLTKLSPAALQEQLHSDETALRDILTGLDDLERRAVQLSSEFAAGKRDYYNQADNDAVRQLLLVYLNYRTALMRLVWKYQRHDELTDHPAQLRAFLLDVTAASALYEASLKFVAQFDRSPETIKKFNEAEPVWGIPANLYDTVRGNLRQPSIRRMMAGGWTKYANRQADFASTKLDTSAPHADFHKAVRQAQETARMLEPKVGVAGVVESFAEAEEAGRKTVYRTKTMVAEWMGDTKIRAPREGRPLIQHDHLAQLTAKLQPGDILLERRNWYVSNAFLPGYWPHAALYVGTPDDLRRLGLDKDPRVESKWREYIVRDAEGHERVIIEAISEGVVFTSMEHSIGGADSAAALRPRRDPARVREAICRAFSHVGKPYDFQFDFFSTDKLVCTELVFRTYDGDIEFPLVSILGTKTLPAIEIVRTYTEGRARPDGPLDFVAFVDGDERKGKAFFSGEVEFIGTLERPALTWLQPGAR